MRNPNHALFRRFCADTCKKKLVTQDDYHQAVDWYLTLSRGGTTCVRKINYRWVQVVSLKFRRTSCRHFSNHYPRSVFMALKSHNRIVSQNTASPQDIKSGGGRPHTHLCGRYYNPFQGEFFKRLASVKTARALVSSYLTSSPLYSTKAVHNVRP